MNSWNFLKRKMRKKSVVVGSAVGAVVVASASSAFAAIDFTAVQTLITAAIADVVAGGLILLGAYAGFWGIKKVMSLFRGG